MLSLTGFVTPATGNDPSVLTPYIQETLASYGPAVAIGVIGAVVTGVIFYRAIFRASWFLTGTRIVGWLWLPLVPVGTLIGIVLLGARRQALDSLKAAVKL